KGSDPRKAHGLRVQRTGQPVQGVEQFAIETNTLAPSAFEGHSIRKLEGKWQPAPDVTVPSGAWEIPMNQPLARLAFYLLEPASDDGVVAWNDLDDRLKDGVTTYPILRTEQMLTPTIATLA